MSRRPWTLAGALLVIAGLVSAQDPVSIAVFADRPLRPIARELVAEATDGLAVRIAVAEEVPAPGPAPVVLFGVDAVQLQQLARQGRLIPHSALPSAGPTGLVPGFLDDGGRYAVTLLSPYTLAFDTRVWSAETAPKVWDDLLFEPEFRGRIGICSPDVSPTPWVAWMQRQIVRGASEDRAYAWLTTLDAAIGRYAESFEGLMRDLDDGRVSLAVAPRSLVQRARALWGLQSIGYRTPDDGAPIQGLGVAVLAGTGAVPEGVFLGQVYGRLVGGPFTAKAARALGIVAVPRLGDPEPGQADDQEWIDFRREWPDGVRAEVWLRHFEENIRGRGRDLESLDSTLDLVFAFVFAGFLVFVYLRIRRSEVRDGRRPS